MENEKCEIKPELDKKFATIPHASRDNKGRKVEYLDVSDYLPTNKDGILFQSSDITWLGLIFFVGLSFFLGFLLGVSA